MGAYKIFMSNLGYLRGINGRLDHHVRYVHRYLYCPVDTQKQALRQLATMLETENPDICCFLEIDTGSSDLANFNQLEALLDDRYPFFDCENKYGPNSMLRRWPFWRGKSNGFIAMQQTPFERVYFVSGTKRLVYRLTLPENITLFFTHFSLKRAVRRKQLLEMRQLLQQTGGECIVMGDFNILNGFQELQPLLEENNLHLLNVENSPTFTFHRMRKALDLCICTTGLVERAHLRILPQPFSDHEALVLELDGGNHA